ncbi:MAG: type II toxin-antitoxin system prevent-host-death family antitoxin [Candidatus Dojkabacteria bacterium]
MTINEASVKYFRDNLAEVVDRVSVGKEIFTVTKFGKRKVYVIPAEIIDNNKDLKSKIHPKTKAKKDSFKETLKILKKIQKSAKKKDLPFDLATNLDKYLYGDGK